MHLYRNREYEEEIVMLMWHKKGEQRIVDESSYLNHLCTKSLLCVTARLITHDWAASEKPCRQKIFEFFLTTGIFRDRDRDRDHLKKKFPAFLSGILKIFAEGGGGFYNNLFFFYTVLKKNY